MFNFKRIEKEPKSIIISRTDKIGDLVLSIPAISTVKKMYPNAKLYVLVRKYNMEVVKGYTFIDGVLAIDDYSKNEYETRFMIVMLFNFIKEEYLDNIKEILETEKFDKYYSQMAAAWLISVMFVKYKDYTLSYLNNNSLDDFTYNKALQKIRESLRVTKEDKELVKKMKRK